MNNNIVLTGNDVFKEEIELVNDQRIGIVGNHTSVDSKGIHLFQNIRNLSKPKSITLFGPEHSFQGNVEDAKEVENKELNDIEDNNKDEKKINVYSLYGDFEIPTNRMFKDLDLVIFDIQDVGVRFYTYICTLYGVMVACKRYNKKLIVLDRPCIGNCEEKNIEGPLNLPKFCSFFSPIPLPIRYCMTIGELANLFNDEKMGTFPPLSCDLRVVRMRNYQRKMFYVDTNLKWISPSPCMSSFHTAIMYPGTCLFEGTNVSEGRGTDTPFLVFGAPWMKIENLRSKLFPLENTIVQTLIVGLRIEEITFLPKEMEGICTKPKYLDTECRGICFKVEDHRLVRNTVKLVVWIMLKLKEVFEETFVVLKFLDDLFGSELLRSAITENVKFEEIVQHLGFGRKEFKNARKRNLLYE